MIDLTPLEVRKKKGDFRRALRGYEPALVDDFLDIVADRLEQVVRENNAFSERVTRLEQQVAENRDRERALTDALVTAQEMREEIKEQTTREADLLRRRSEQEAETRVRDAEQQAETTLRDAEQRADTLLRDAEQRAEERLRATHQEAEERLRSAHHEADTRLRQAQQEVEARLRQAEQESYAMRTDAMQVRKREEEQLRQVRARQQQLLASYRTFLERELAELNAITDSLKLGRGAAGESADVADAATAGGEDPSMPEAPAPRAAAAPETGHDAAPVREAPRRGRSAPPADLRDPFGQEPTGAADLTLFPPAAADELILLGEDLLSDDRLGDVMLPDEEPFEPEPVYDEDLEEPGLTRIQPAELLRQPESAERPEPGEGKVESWPALDMLQAGEEPDFSRPRRNMDALELPSVEEQAPAPAAPVRPPKAGEGEGISLADLLDEDEDEADADPETDALLQNAARAGYRLELEEEPELLLDEPVTEAEAEEEDESDWLNRIIEEEK